MFNVSMLLLLHFLLVNSLVHNIVGFSNLDVFTPCTFLFINVKQHLQHPFSSLQHSAYKFCQVNSHCISLFATIVESEGVDQNWTVIRQQKKILTNITNHLYAIFKVQRYHNICLTKFPSFRLENRVLMFSNLYARYFLRHDDYETRIPLESPQDFALMHLHGAGVDFKKLKISVSVDLSTTLTFFPSISFDNYESDLFFLYFVNDCNYSLEHCDLQQIAFSYKSVAEQLQDYVKQIGSMNRRYASQNLFGYRENRLLEQTEYPKIQMFALHLLLLNYNCTWKWNCKDSMYQAKSLFSHTEDGNLYFDTTNYKKMLPYGLRIFNGGIKYFVFPGLDQNYVVVGRLGSFLKPFDNLTWFGIMLFLFTSAVVIFLSKRTKSMVDIIFWLGFTIFEQNDDGKRFRNKFSCIVLLFWMVAFIFMRNFYTSEMYAEITAPKEHIPFPPCFDQIFGNNYTSSFYKLVATYRAHTTLSIAKFHAEKEKYLQLNNTLSLYLSKLYTVTEHVSQITLSKSILLHNPCDSLGCIINPYTEMPQTNLIVFTDTEYDADNVWSNLVVDIVGKRVIFENNDKPFLENFAWYNIHPYTVYKNHVLEIFGRFYSSGIVYYLEEIVSRSNSYASELKFALNEVGYKAALIRQTYARHAIEKLQRRPSATESSNIEHKKINLKLHTAENHSSTFVSTKKLIAVWKLLGILLSFDIIVYVLECSVMHIVRERMSLWLIYRNILLFCFNFSLN